MATDTQALTAAEYLRVSKDKSGRERSPEEQHTDNERAAQGRGWTLGQTYRDNGSASRYGSKVRGDFGRLLADLESGKFAAQVLVLWESSRGSRRVGEWVTLIDLCERRKVLIHVTSDSKTYDPGNARDRRSLLEDAVDGEYESAKVSKRSKRAQAANAAEGKPSGPVPYGYRRVYDPATRALVRQEPEPAEAAVVAELFDRLHKGHSLRSIVRDFDARGIRTRAGKPFSHPSLREMGLRHTYAGIRVHDPHGRTGKPTAAATYTKAIWKPLVTKAQFLAVQRMLTAPERLAKAVRPGRAQHLLSMIARCDVCSGPLTKYAQSRGSEYYCRDGGHIRVSYDELNDLAEKAMLGWLSRKDNVERLTADDRNDEQLAAVRTEIAEIAAELDDLADKVGRGQLSATLAARAEPGILARKRTAEEREKELTTPSALRGLIAPGKDVARRWKAAPIETRREVARILLQPNVIGELRVTRGRGIPTADRVVWARALDDPMIRDTVEII